MIEKIVWLEIIFVVSLEFMDKVLSQENILTV